MTDMQGIIDEALKDRVFAGRELNLRQRLEIAKHIDGALTAHGFGKLPDPPRYKCEACGYPDDEADSKFWRCSLCGCLDHELATS